MESRAKVTSKGQVTVPVEVRRELGIEEGDVLVFEIAPGYATVRKRRPAVEVTAEVRERYLVGRAPRSMTNREAVEEYFATQCEQGLGDEVYVSRGGGTFEIVSASAEADDDVDR